MQHTPATEKKRGQWWKLLLKIAVSAVCIWYVSTKIDFTIAGEALGKTKPWLLVMALLAFVISKILASVRLNIYFRNIALQIPEWPNLKLYWLGMFYNLFLPGSISGDAYKVILLTKKYNINYKKPTAAVLLDRFSGLLGLGLILAVYGFMVLENQVYSSLLAAGAVAATVVVYLAIRKWFSEFTVSFAPTLLLGILVQAAQVVCAYLIMASLGIHSSLTAYVFLFLASSVVSVLPLSVGGLGIREIVFLEGSHYLGLLRETAVVISILFYLITVFTSAFGLIYVFRDPLKEKRAHF